MNRFFKLAMLVVGAFLATSVSAMAEDAAAQSLIELTPTFGAGLVVIGAGLGISKLSSAAFESMARQPEVAGDVRGGMIIVAAMIEGAAVIGLIVCLIK